MTRLMPITSFLLTQGPIFLIWLVALVLAVVRWQRHPRVSLMLTVALVLFFFGTLIGGIMQLMLPRLLMRSSGRPQFTGLLMILRSIISVVLNTIAWGLTVAAVFGQRQPGTGAPVT